MIDVTLTTHSSLQYCQRLPQPSCYYLLDRWHEQVLATCSCHPRVASCSTDAVNEYLLHVHVTLPGLGLGLEQGISPCSSMSTTSAHIYHISRHVHYSFQGSQRRRLESPPPRNSFTTGSIRPLTPSAMFRIATFSILREPLMRWILFDGCLATMLRRCLIRLIKGAVYMIPLRSTPRSTHATRTLPWDIPFRRLGVFIDGGLGSPPLGPLCIWKTSVADTSVETS